VHEQTCKDCRADDKITAVRPAPYAGPRCFSHHHAQKRARRLSQRLGAVRRGFGLAPADYEALWAAGRFTAGGKRLCDICPSVVGTVKQPATDHDHRHCGGPTGCRLCVRGLLCSTCNRYLGHIGDDPETGYRLALHLISPLWPKVRNALDDS
jgi:hypothetical protein